MGKRLCIVRDSEKLKAVIGHRLRQSGLTLHEVSKRTGIPKSRMYSWMSKGKRTMTQVNILTLADFLGIDIDLKIDLRN